MSTAHTSTRGDTELLDDRLRLDPNGELLTKLLDELNQSNAEIRAALGQFRTDDERNLLRGLQQALHTSQSMLRDVWQELHKRPAPC